VPTEAELSRAEARSFESGEELVVRAGESEGGCGGRAIAATTGACGESADISRFFSIFELLVQNLILFMYHERAPIVNKRRASSRLVHFS
jgi:hypothetical protein